MLVCKRGLEYCWQVSVSHKEKKGAAAGVGCFLTSLSLYTVWGFSDVAYSDVHIRFSFRPKKTKGHT